MPPGSPPPPPTYDRYQFVFTAIKGYPQVEDPRRVQLAQIELLTADNRPVDIVQAANPGGVSIDEQGAGNLLTDTLTSKWLDSNITQADGSVLSTVILYLAKEVEVTKYRLVAAADNERRQPVSWEVGIAGSEGGFFPLSTVTEGSAGVTYYMVAPPPPPPPPPPCPG